jgi:hypothetical protein
MEHLTNLASNLPGELPLEILVGGPLDNLVCRPFPPYSPRAIEFLAQLSHGLLKHSAIRTYPDIAGFAYWCRRANLTRLARSFENRGRRIGRGLVLHIAPANVPVNFGFSLAFGLLAGNANIMRLPGVNHPQARIICTEMGRILGQPTHVPLAEMIRVIKYPRNDEITRALSESCHARVLWGGDATIAHLRSIPTSARCVDVAFADRYSLCAMGANAILVADAPTLQTLVAGFYNDVFLLDQNACSSPHLILWQGEEAAVEQAMTRFWGAMEHFLLAKPTPPPIHSLDKYAHLCRTAIGLESWVSVRRHQNLIYRVQLKHLPQDLDKYRGQYGFFFEITDNDWMGLKTIVGERYQTVTYFGIDPEEIINLVLDCGLVGIDRVVPVGKALDIGVIWDGYDLIGTLSRVVSDQ